MKSFTSRGRASRITGVVIGLGLALSSASVASANMTGPVAGTSTPLRIGAGGTASYTAGFVTYGNSGVTRYFMVSEVVNAGGAAGLSASSACKAVTGNRLTSIDFTLTTTIGSTAPGVYAPTVRLREYTDSLCTAMTGNARTFGVLALWVGSTVYVVADNKTVTVGGAIPTYTYTLHEDSPTGPVFDPSGLALYTAPTCGSTYTASTPASASPVAIHCTGGWSVEHAFVAVDGAVTINKVTPAFAFGPIDDKTVGDPDFSVAGNVTLDADNDGAVTFAEVAGSTGCEVNSAGSIRVTGEGTCTVSASVAETGKYLAAGPLTQSFTINAPAPTPTPTATPSATPTETQAVEAVTANPTQRVTPAPTSTAPDAPGTSTPLFALLICLAFGGLGLLSVSAQKRSIRD